LTNLARQIDYAAARKRLDKAFAEAEVDFGKEQIAQVSSGTETAADTLFESGTQAFREALVGCALARILDQGFDIRLPYVKQGDDAFNGRTLDERVVNPFLHEKEIPSSKGPYLSALRRNVSFVKETAKGLRDKAAYGAFLRFLGESATSR